MGSATVIDSKPTLPMAEYTDKKSIKNILKKPFQALFKDKKKEKKREKDVPKTEEPVTAILPPPKVTPVATLLENFRKLEIEKKQTENEANEEKTEKVVEEKTQTEPEEDEEDEFKDFTIQIVEEDRRNERIDSHSSQDSGFSEKVTHSDDEKEKEKDVVESLEKLSIGNNTEKKKKRLQTIIVARTPIRNKGGNRNGKHPYHVAQESETQKQINQVNKQMFSGGQVTVNSQQNIADSSEIRRALTQVEMNVQTFVQNSRQDQAAWWDSAQEFLNEKSCPRSVEVPDDILSGFPEVQVPQENFDTIETINNYASKEVSQSNPIEEFSNSNHTEFERIDSVEIPSIPAFVHDESVQVPNNKSYMYPTPPRSENVPSPLSDSQVSSLFYASPNSEHTFSPERSSPFNSDYEKYQEITQLDDQYPRCVSESFEEKSTNKPKPRERNLSSSSMTLKQFKDLQKELATGFSKKDCCQINRKSCKEIFEEHMQKLSQEERNRLCCEIANLSFKDDYGILQHILIQLSRSNANLDIQYTVFSLVCEKILSQRPSIFIEDFGLNLLKSATLRCYRRPLLTRYLVQCIRTALRIGAFKLNGKESVFHEVDALGDTLLIACVRAGDAYADVLSELVRRQPDQPPLFNVYHANADGYSALHVACSEHSSGSPRLHVTHVLLEHGGADLWKGDVKGGDTALHLAVNSLHCDLNLIMIMFRHVDRKMWKQLAHAQNRSSVTPLEYARSGTKSTIRQNYPHEVLDFLKKCR